MKRHIQGRWVTSHGTGLSAEGICWTSRLLLIAWTPTNDRCVPLLCASEGGGCSGDNTTPRYLRSDSSASRNLDSSNGARASHGAGLSNESSADRRLAERVGSTLSQEFATSTSDVAVPGDSAGTHGHRDKSGEAFSGSGKLAPDAGFAARSSKKNGRGEPSIATLFLTRSGARENSVIRAPIRFPTRFLLFCRVR